MFLKLVAQLGQVRHVPPVRIHSNFHWTQGAHVATFGSTKLFMSVPSFHSRRRRRRLLNREYEEKEDMRWREREGKERDDSRDEEED